MGQAANLALIGVLGGGALVAAAPPAAADPQQTYYVSADGNDAADGTSPATAWRSLGPVGSRALAGDTVLLQGGATFAGPLMLGSDDDGVTVGSFGSGRARITSHGAAGVSGYDVAGATVRDLQVVGDGPSFASKGGVSFYNDHPAGRRLSGLALRNLTVRGFRNGVEIGGANQGAGFAQVVISHVKAVGNRDAGIITYGPAFRPESPSYANADVTVTRSVASRNLGNPADKVHNSGNGIVLGSVDGGSVTRSIASGNGSLCTAPEGPAGIWTYDSRGIRIVHNTSTNNRTGGSVDGDGFDLDQNVTDSLLAHNTSSGNDGAGYLVYAGAEAATTGNVVRDNTSAGDAGNNDWYGGITLAGKVHGVTVTGNSVDTTSSASHAPALAVREGVSRAKISRNQLRAAPGYRVVARGAAG